MPVVNLLIISFAMVINISTQILWVRIKGRFSYFSIFLGFFVGLSILISATPAVEQVIFYFSAGYVYFHYVNIGEASLRIRILQIVKAANGEAGENSILALYNANKILDARIERLLARGELEARADKYFLGRPKMIYVAKFFRFLKLVIMKKQMETI